MSLEGDLSELGIGEILQTLTLSHHEGTLKITSEQEGDRYFYLSKGEIQLVVPGRKATKLGDSLVKAGKITHAQLERALEEQKKTGSRIGDTLVRLGLIAEAAIDDVVRQQFREQFFEIFLLAKGRFEFFFHTRPDHLVQFDETVSRVSLNTSALMLEALRHIDEWRIMSRSIPTPRTIFKVVESLDGALAELKPSAELRQAIALIDGRHTVSEIVEKTTATKFDLYSLIHKLVEKRTIRPLTHREALDLAVSAESTVDTLSATVFFEYAAYLMPFDVETRERQYALLRRLGVYKEAKEAALALADVKLADRDLEGALKFYLEAQACDEKDLRAAEGVYRASSLIGTNVARTVRAGDEYVRLAMRHQKRIEAREALTALVELDPEGAKRKILLADLLDDDREQRVRAIHLLEEALALLHRPEDAMLKAEAARKLLALDSGRTDAQSKLVEAVDTARSQVVRHRVKLAAIATGAFLLLALAYLGSYELGARRAFGAAREIADQAGSDIGLLNEAIARYRTALASYPHATGADEARARMAGIGAHAATLTTETARAEAREREARESRAQNARSDAARSLLARADAFERQAKYREAAEALLEVVQDYADVKLDRRVKLPVPVSTTPAGATVGLLGETSTTPAVLHVDPFQEVKVRIELVGYAAREVPLRGNRFEEVRLALERRALWTYTAGGAVETGPAAGGGRVLVAARDGFLYSLRADTGAEAYKLKLGEYGDFLSAPALVAGKCIVGTTDGVVHAVDPALGTDLWTVDARGAVRSAVHESSDGRLLAFGSATGLAHFVATATGASLFTIATRERVDGGLAFDEARAYVASRDGTIRAVDLEKKAIAWTFEGDDAFLAGPLVVGGVLVAGARNGAIYGVDAASGKKLWRLDEARGRVRAAPAVAGRLVLVPCEDGTLYAIDIDKHAVRWRFQADAPLVATPAVTKRGAYVPSTAGTLTCLDAETGGVRWTFSMGAGILGTPGAADGRIYIGAEDGTVKALVE